jgi:hypothetical protein
MSLEVAVGLGVGVVIAGLWDQPGIQPGWLLLGAMLTGGGIFSASWVALGLGVLCLFLAFASPAGGGR